MPWCACVLRGLGRTIGVLGTGKIGECFVRIMRGECNHQPPRLNTCRHRYDNSATLILRASPVFPPCSTPYPPHHAWLSSALSGFGCKVYAYDPFPRQDLVTSGLIDGYMERIEDVLAVADIVSMHLPLTPSTYHLIDDKKLLAMKPVRVPVVPTYRSQSGSQ